MSKSISKNAAFKAILNLFNIILPILVMPVVTTSLKSSYSYIAKGETFNTIFLAFASFGVYQYGLREISKVRDDEKRLRQTFTSLFVITTFTTIIVSVIYMIFLFSFYRNDPAFYTCVILGFNIVFNLFYVEWINEALENYDFIAIKTMIVRIISSIIILCVVRGQDNYLFYLYLSGAVNLINNLLSYFYIKKRIKFDFSNLKIIQYIKPMFLVVILSNTSLLYTMFDRLMIGHYSFDMDLAAYAIAQKAIFIINTLMLTIIQVTMPRLSNDLGNNSKDNYFTLLNRVVKIYFLFLFPASIGLLCVSKQVMWIFEYKYASYVSWYPLMMGFSLYMLTIGIQGIISNQIIYLHRKEKEDVKIFFIGGVANVVLNILLLIANMFTVTNSIIATMISNIIVIIFEYRLVKKQIKLDIHIFAFENIKYFYYSVLFIPMTFTINHFISSMVLSCALDVTACGLLYLGILLITKDIVFFEIYDRAVTKLKALF
jgi:O-antigen/teichoic acid export membrane protein